jgi:hypothetical protein
MSDTVAGRDEAIEAFLADLPEDPPQGSQFTLRIQPGHDLGPTYQAGELVTLHVDNTPTLGATWLFECGDDVTIALVLGWDDVHWFVQDAEGAWKVCRADWLPRARFARGR